ncbi:MAG: hypothetical protein IT299_09355 [Dehalococcoidia bacterium]|nr:hypothetical protein [Dehalococcoidia bacterium]
MSALLAAGIATAIAVVLAATQLALELTVDSPDALPVLPVALVTTWAVVRHPIEPAVALPPVAWILGVASEQAVGWLLIALVPALLLGIAGRALGSAHAIAGSVVASAAGALAYLAILAASPTVAPLPAALASTGWTAVAALAAALALFPFRPRERGLFG